MSEFSLKELDLASAAPDGIGELHGGVHLRDGEGAIRGVVLSPREYKQILYRSFELPFSDEELRSFSRETGVHTLQEIWQRLGVR